jgi:predicted acyl esterase
LTRGWLRGSQRRLDAAESKPWQPVHRHTAREPLTPGDIYEFNIEIRPYGILLKPGERIGIKIKGADNDPAKNYLELVGIGHVSSATASQVTVHHSSNYPSHLLLPITKGNRIGTFISGGKLPPVKRP